MGNPYPQSGVGVTPPSSLPTAKSRPREAVVVRPPLPHRVVVVDSSPPQ